MKREKQTAVAHDGDNDGGGEAGKGTIAASRTAHCPLFLLLDGRHAAPSAEPVVGRPVDYLQGAAGHEKKLLVEEVQEFTQLDEAEAARRRLVAVNNRRAAGSSPERTEVVRFVQARSQVSDVARSRDSWRRRILRDEERLVVEDEPVIGFRFARLRNHAVIERQVVFICHTGMPLRLCALV